MFITANKHIQRHQSQRKLFAEAQTVCWSAHSTHDVSRQEIQGSKAVWFEHKVGRHLTVPARRSWQWLACQARDTQGRDASSEEQVQSRSYIHSLRQLLTSQYGICGGGTDQHRGSTHTACNTTHRLSSHVSSPAQQPRYTMRRHHVDPYVSTSTTVCLHIHNANAQVRGSICRDKSENCLA